MIPSFSSSQMFSPPLSAGLMEGLLLSSQTRCLKRKSLSSSAPTGQMSTTLTDSLLLIRSAGEHIDLLGGAAPP